MGYLLVIDDDEKLCDLIARCLGAPGRRCAAAATVWPACNCCAPHRRTACW